MHVPPLSTLFLASASLFLQYPTVHGVAGVSQQVLNSPVLIPEFASNITTVARPFYAIAHRVLTVQGIKDAINHGANAIEIDVTAWKPGWWADHDGTDTSRGDSVRTMFATIAELRQAGFTLSFVWLDIKNPDWCDPDDPKWRICSIANLQELARYFLVRNGVRVLYGFYQSTADGTAYGRIRDGLSDGEAINVNGKANQVRDKFISGGPADITKRVMSYGYYRLQDWFGDCHEPTYNTCTELRQGVQSGAFGKVFGWTVVEGQTYYVDKLLDVAGVDGLIYGFQRTYYYDHADTRQAARDVLSWVWNHRDRLFIATQGDPPW